MTTLPTTETRGNTEGRDGDILLDIKNLKMYFPVTAGIIFQRAVAQIKAVDDVSFFVRRGETLGLVGESGCGKTTTGRCILQLYHPTAGEIKFDGEELSSLFMVIVGTGLGGGEIRGGRAVRGRDGCAGHAGQGRSQSPARRASANPSLS